MTTRLRLLLTLILLPPLLSAAPLTYDNNPLGDYDFPLVFRTYMPDPGLDDAIFAHHGRSANSPKYNPSQGKDVSGEFKPVDGIPAAIGVNHGPALSYCFDTTECRLLYAWQGGFLDMYPYWGDPSRGNRLSNNYVPHLVGSLFYKTSGQHPLHLDGKSISAADTAPKFLGYSLLEHSPTFRYKVGPHTITARILPSEDPLTLQAEFTCEPMAKLAYQTNDAKITVTHDEPGNLVLLLSHQVIENFQGFPRNLNIKEATVANGQLLFETYGCMICHSLDGSASHGPTFAKLYGSQRKITGLDKPLLADDAYLLESIKDPNAKTVDGFPPNYMPPFVLKDLEYQSLVLFIQSLEKGE
ncbi:MAG: cytochrome c [Verrucomicrobia bacterium]|nr:cytochrome c [Verrucomicrobiota bacterium]MDA1005590.1 cytochrome c [Verrucomicrobiota bacterium]